MAPEQTDRIDTPPTEPAAAAPDASAPVTEVKAPEAPAEKPDAATTNAVKRLQQESSKAQAARAQLLAQAVTIIQDNQLPMSAILGELAKRTGTKVVLLVQSKTEGVAVDISGPTTIGDAFSMVHLADIMLEERVRAPFRQQPQVAVNTQAPK